jgi:Cu+-exporting ATPase
VRAERLTFPIDDLQCGGALIVERALVRVPGVVHVYVNPATEMAYIQYNPTATSAAQLIAAVERIGFKTGTPSMR